MCLPWSLSSRLPSPFHSSSITVSSSSPSGMRPSSMTELLCIKGCESGYDECRRSMSLERCDEGQVEKDGAELSREEPEDVDGESGGVGCRSLTWSNGHDMGHLKGRGRRQACKGGGDVGRIKKRMKRMKARVGAPAPRNMTASGLVGGQYHSSDVTSVAFSTHSGRPVGPGLSKSGACQHDRNCGSPRQGRYALPRTKHGLDSLASPYIRCMKWSLDSLPNSS